MVAFIPFSANSVADHVFVDTVMDADHELCQYLMAGTAPAAKRSRVPCVKWLTFYRFNGIDIISHANTCAISEGDVITHLCFLPREISPGYVIVHASKKAATLLSNVSRTMQLVLNDPAAEPDSYQ